MMQTVLLLLVMRAGWWTKKEEAMMNVVIVCSDSAHKKNKHAKNKCNYLAFMNITLTRSNANSYYYLLDAEAEL